MVGGCFLPLCEATGNVERGGKSLLHCYAKGVDVLFCPRLKSIFPRVVEQSGEDRPLWVIHRKESIKGSEKSLSLVMPGGRALPIMCPCMGLASVSR